MIRKNPLFLFLLPLILVIMTGTLYPQEKNTPQNNENRRTSLNWPDIKEAIQYKIQIGDVNYKTVQQSTVTESQIELSLPDGEYRVRIGVINKFYKLANWSDWAVLKVGEKPVKKKKEKVLFSNSFKIGIGIPYFQIYSDYNKYLNNSYYGATICAGSRMPNLIPFLNWDFLNYTGLEIEATYIKFEGKKIPNRLRTDKIDILAGGNIYFATNFNFPANLILRGGAGLLQTKFEYQSSVAEDIEEFSDRALTSLDYYYKAGASIEFTPAKYIFLEFGADVCDFIYISDNFRVIRYYLLAGIML